jgi:RHS repeat-associated protein
LGNVVGEYNGAGNLLAHYDHGLGLLSRTDAGGNPAYDTFDAIGNVQQLVTSAGAIANAYAYSPFGGLFRQTEAIPNSFQFVGQFGVMNVKNGLSFMRSRHYQPSLGRLLSADPLGGVGGENVYMYAGNAPTRYVDPLGLVKVTVYVEPGVFVWEGHAAIAVEGSPLSYLSKHPKGGPRPFGPTEFKSWEAESEWRKNSATAVEFDVSEATAARMRAMIDVLKSRKDPFSGLFDNCVDAVQMVLEFGGFPHWPDLIPEELLDSVQLYAESLKSKQAAVAGATDPNTKTGPAGFGTNGFIAASNTLAYRVDFENESNATAPAQIVTVTDQLDGDLDWTTFELTEIGFGDTRIAVPAKSQHFETSVPMEYNGVSFEVQIEAGIHLTTGEVYANLYSIDPVMGLPPTVDIGFLPPEDGTGRGQGYFSYVSKPKQGLVTGTEVRNVARISFDFQQTIATNQVDPHDPSRGTDPNKECLNTISTGVCGDGVVDPIEECDDGNTTGGDGCSANCTVEPDYTCTGSPSVCAPAATATPTPTVTPTPRCFLDVDGSGPPPDVATDIVYIARYLLGLACVPPSFRMLDPSIPSDGDIAANVNAMGNALDVDASGTSSDVATDIVYIARHLLGLTPVPPSFRVIDPSIPSDADIAARIDALCP